MRCSPSLFESRAFQILPGLPSTSSASSADLLTSRAFPNASHNRREAFGYLLDTSHADSAHLDEYWWVVLGSNQWPLLCESSALPLS